MPIAPAALLKRLSPAATDGECLKRYAEAY